MFRLIEVGSSLQDLARVMGRTEGDIEQQAAFLGVRIPHHEALRVLTRTTDSCAASLTVHYAPFAQSPRRIGA